MKPGQGAFTLLELLTALAILLLVLATVLTLHQAALRATERAEKKPAEHIAEKALDRLLRDLNCAVLIEHEDVCAFHLESGGDHARETWFRLSFCTTTPFDNPADPRWYGIEHVTYSWTAADVRSLVRVSKPVSRAPSSGAETNTTALAADHLTVQVYDGENWSSSWTTGGLPRAVRMVWQTQKQSFTAETFVAAGVTVMPRKTREANERRRDRTFIRHRSQMGIRLGRAKHAPAIRRSVSTKTVPPPTDGRAAPCYREVPRLRAEG